MSFKMRAMPSTTNLLSCDTETNIDPPLPDLMPRAQRDWRNLALLCALLLTTFPSILVVVHLHPASADVLMPRVRINDFYGLTAALAALVAVIGVHELGHFVAGIYMQFTILSVRIGPVRISRLHGKLNVQFSLKAMFTGSVSAIPAPRDGSWRSKMLIVVAAGPFATLLSGVGAVVLAGHTPPQTWTHFTLSIVSTMSFAVFIMGFAPNGQDARVPNDAQLFYAFLRNGNEARDIYAYHALMHLRISGDRPRNYPVDVIRLLAERRTRPDIALLCADTIVLWATDCGESRTACAWDRRSLELSTLCSRSLRNLAIAKSACLDVVLRSDLNASRCKFTEVRLQEISPVWMRERLAAARLTADGRIDAALGAISRARQSFPKHLPYFAFEEMLMRRIAEFI